MLSRRQLRVKVLQALYAFFQSDKSDLAVAERELFRSIDKVYELYIALLLLLKELSELDKTDSVDLHHKFIPNKEELAAKHRLFQLKFLDELENSAQFKADVKKLEVNWQSEHDLVRKIFLEIKKSPEYRVLISAENIDEKEFLLQMTQKFIEDFEPLKNYIEENNIYWMEDFDFVCHIIGKTIKKFYEENKLEIIPVYKDKADDSNFVKELFAKTILHNEEYEKAIADKTKNWEVDRIELVDILLLKMSLAEMIAFPNIPVKVSINEYIEISKEYSTPRSKVFINGIIDKIAIEFKADGRIVKTGRGLME